MEEAEAHCAPHSASWRRAASSPATAPAGLLERHAVDHLDDVFEALTAPAGEPEEGRRADLPARCKVARRLG